MSRRNDYDYFDLDNFDDSIDSREYRRRQQRRPASYAARPSSQRSSRRHVCPAKRQLKQAIGSMRKIALANRKKKK